MAPFRSVMHKYSFVLLAVLAALPSVSAQGVVLPAGLQGGDPYRLLIVTEGRRNAVSTNIADYNAFVTAEAAGTPGARCAQHDMDRCL